MRLTALYEPDGETGRQLPIWLLAQPISLSGTGTIYIRLDAPFETAAADELEPDDMTLIVPDHVYVRHHDQQGAIGLNRPALQAYIRSIAAASVFPVEPQHINKLLLRIEHIEEAMSFALRRTAYS